MDNRFKYCAACLVTDVKMYSLAAKYTSNSSNTLGNTFSRLLQIPMYEESEHVCFECTALMCKFLEFRTRCEKAKAILSTVKIKDDAEIIRNVIQNVDRKAHKLTSNLTLSCIEVTNIICDPIESPMKAIDVGPMKIEEEGYQNVKEEDKNINKKELEYCGEQDVKIEHNFEGNSQDPDLVEGVKVTKSPKTRKRKIKDEIKSIQVENNMCDDKHLHKVSKKLNKKVGNVKNKFPKKFNINGIEEFATVVTMTPEDAKKELLLRKESSCYQNSTFKCELCYKGYEMKDAYDNHMKRHSVEFGEHECDLCHLRFLKQSLLHSHSLACHKRKFYCKKCPYICYCIIQAKNHVKSHMGKNYPCPDCDEVYSLPNSLFMHKRMKHNLAEVVCEMCGSTFTTTRGLFAHNVKMHRQEVNNKHGPKCDDCGIHFATEMAWKKHLVLSSKHASKGCKHCGETFTNSEDLKSHSKIHARKPTIFIDKFPTVCSICDKSLWRRIDYKSHMMTEHPQSDVAKRLACLDKETPYICEECGKMFKKQCFLRYHQRKHTGERPYSCPECDKSYSAKSTLETHRARVHERATRHPCRLCDRTFKCRSGLGRHMKVHLNIRPHKCSLCGQGFINPSDMKLHVKCVHNKEPWPKRKKPKQQKCAEISNKL